MSHPISEFSERSRGRILTAGIPHTPEPFTPENLPRIQYEMHGETTVDQRATEMLRKPTEAEIKQLGSEYRSDLNPSNYRVASVFISSLPDGTIIEPQLDFQCWAFRPMVQGVYTQPATITYPAIGIYLLPEVLAVSNFSFYNLPVGRKMKFVVSNIGAVDPTVGYHIYMFDRWIPGQNY